ncbi:MAG: hypothetical protein J6Y13_01525, partial [Treponema sp.]|nr:hypothetical protein [Treponema sp.]
PSPRKANRTFIIFCSPQICLEGSIAQVGMYAYQGGWAAASEEWKTSPAAKLQARFQTAFST